MLLIVSDGAFIAGFFVVAHFLCRIRISNKSLLHSEAPPKQPNVK